MLFILLITALDPGAGFLLDISGQQCKDHSLPIMGQYDGIAGDSDYFCRIDFVTYPDQLTVDNSILAAGR